MLRIISFSVCFLILYNQQYSRGTPLTGKNVRHANKSEFPFVVSLSWKNSIWSEKPEEDHFCGGALISARLILTAAHCVKNLKSPDEIVVKVTKGDLRDSKIYNVKNWITYDEYAKNNITNDTFNDIAIVKVIGCVSTKLAILTKIPEAQLYGKKAVIAARGFIENSGSPRYLLTAELDVLKAEDCFRNWHKTLESQINRTTHVFMCTAADPPVYTSCGDSGSAVLINSNEIIAVHKGTCERRSNGTLLARQNLHMSVDHYRQFITDVINCNKKQGCTIL